jgi:hypothetical protein
MDMAPGCRLPLMLRAVAANTTPRLGEDAQVTCPEPPATVLEQGAGAIALVRKSRVTSVNTETTDDS